MANLGLFIFMVLIAAALLAPVLAPTDPTQQNLAEKLTGPSIRHPLGMDAFGRDVWSRIVYGSRTTLLIGSTTVALAALLGVPIGLIAGYFGGRIDNVLMRIMDALLSFPPIMLALALMGTLGPATQNVILALGVVYAPAFARLARSSTLSIKAEDFIAATRCLGASSIRIIFVHVLPNALAPLIVQATFNFSSAIIAAATLSFLGLGVQPPTPDWGSDLSDGRRFISSQPWLVVWPTLAMSVTVLAINFIGDGLRDALDPRASPI
jgi:peptide/nickel transport system permease protein